MDKISEFLFVAGGVAIAVVLPVLADAVREYYPESFGTGWKLPRWTQRYLLLGLFSFVVAAIILAGWKSHSPTSLEWHQALLLGFTSEAAIEKTLRPRVSSRRRTTDRPSS
jgi:hypothetical protein